MADLLRENPNLMDDIFKELEAWEEILNSLPEFPEDESHPADDPPDLSPS